MSCFKATCSRLKSQGEELNVCVTGLPRCKGQGGCGGSDELGLSAGHFPAVMDLL